MCIVLKCIVLRQLNKHQCGLMLSHICSIHRSCNLIYYPDVFCYWKQSNWHNIGLGDFSTLQSHSVLDDRSSSIWHAILIQKLIKVWLVTASNGKSDKQDLNLKNSKLPSDFIHRLPHQQLFCCLEMVSVTTESPMSSALCLLVAMREGMPVLQRFLRHWAAARGAFCFTQLWDWWCTYTPRKRNFGILIHNKESRQLLTS